MSASIAPQSGPEFKAPTTGLLKRRTVADFLRGISPKLGFILTADDIIGARDTGNGMNIRRKFHAPPAFITLYLDLQYKWAEEFFCTGVFDSTVPSYYTTKTQVAHYTTGDVTTTVTQPGPGPWLWNPISNPSMHSCASASTTITDNRTPPGSGILVSTDPPSYSGILDASTLLSPAAAAVEADGSPYAVQTWGWLQRTPKPSGITQSLAYWTTLANPYSVRKVLRYDYRWRITGGIPLRIQWTASGTNYNVVVPGSGDSGWYHDTLPTLGESANADKITAVTISEMR